MAAAAGGRVCSPRFDRGCIDARFRLRDGKTGMANVRTASNAVEARALLEALYVLSKRTRGERRRLLRAVPAVGSVVHHELEKLHDIVKGASLRRLPGPRRKRRCVALRRPRPRRRRRRRRGRGSRS